MNTLSNPGEMPEYKLIPLSELFIDNSYQRTTEARRSRLNIERLRDNFTWKECGVLIVAHVPDKGGYAVLDGQHRIEAVKLRGDIDKMPCFIINDIGTAEQAKSFVGINQNRVELNFLTKFHARVAAGNKEDVFVVEFLKECGFTVPKSQYKGKSTASHEIVCIAAIRSLLKPDLKETLKWALNIIPEAFGEKPGMLRADLIKPLVAFKKSNSDLVHSVVVEMLQTMNIMASINEAKQAARTTGQKTEAIMLHTLERKYKTKSIVIGGKSNTLAPPPPSQHPQNPKKNPILLFP